jgi:hypothetical protein
VPPLGAGGVSINAHDLWRVDITAAASADISPLALKALVNRSLGGEGGAARPKIGAPAHALYVAPLGARVVVLDCDDQIWSLSMTQLSTTVINKLVLARHLFRMAEDNLRSQRDVALFASVTSMQDAVEAFLLAVADQVNATIGQNVNFDAYFTKINERIQPKTLSFQGKLAALNKARVNAKHYGLRPDRKELERFAVACREFFEETSAFIFAHPFWSVSLIDLLPDGEVKQLLENATTVFEDDEHLSCLIECRKVIFVLFEHGYDVAKFREATPGILSGFISDAPLYAQNKEYIEQRVKDPYDYIVLDHERLTRDLLSDGIDPQVFWNVRRLTPPVYRPDENAGWMVKRVLEIEANADKDHAAYVLDQTVDVALRLDERKRLVRMIVKSGHHIRLKREQVNVYDKADRNSTVLSVTKAGLLEVDVDAATEGLNGDAIYWHVSHLVKDAPKGMALFDMFYYGYIHDDDIDWGD